MARLCNCEPASGLASAGLRAPRPSPREAAPQAQVPVLAFWVGAEPPEYRTRSRMSQVRLRVITNKVYLLDAKRQLPDFRGWEEVGSSERAAGCGSREQESQGLRKGPDRMWRAHSFRVRGNFTNTHYYESSGLSAPKTLAMIPKELYLIIL